MIERLSGLLLLIAGAYVTFLVSSILTAAGGQPMQVSSGMGETTTGQEHTASPIQVAGEGLALQGLRSHRPVLAVPNREWRSDTRSKDALSWFQGWWRG